MNYRGVARARAVSHDLDRGMNQTESAYASVLQLRLLAGELLRWDYEPEKLRLADLTWYTPDFRVVLANGRLEFHEVKACKANGEFLCEDDARVKFKVAAEQHPIYGFRLCGRLAKRAGWRYESLNCDAE
jgi:hypothetical protein